MTLGASVLSLGSGTPDIDLDIEFDADADFDLADAATFSVDTDFDTTDMVALASYGLMGWLGLKNVPFLIWLVSFLTLFGLSGLIAKNAVQAVAGAFLPVWFAMPLAVLPAIFGARFMTGVVAAIMPKAESSAMRMRFLGGHTGTISQGIARRGKPAEAKIRDRYGNIHYLRVEPLEDTGEIPQGHDVRVIRRKDGAFYVVDITWRGTEAPLSQPRRLFWTLYHY